MVLADLAERCGSGWQRRISSNTIFRLAVFEQRFPIRYCQIAGTVLMLLFSYMSIGIGGVPTGVFIPSDFDGAVTVRA